MGTKRKRITNVATADDASRYVSVNFDLVLSNEVKPLLSWMAGEVLSFHHMDASVRPTTRNKIIEACDFLIANFLIAYQISNQCYVGLYLRPGGYVRNARYRMQIPVHRGQSFRRIADSIPVIADSF